MKLSTIYWDSREKVLEIYEKRYASNKYISEKISFSLFFSWSFKHIMVLVNVYGLIVLHVMFNFPPLMIWLLTSETLQHMFTSHRKHLYRREKVVMSESEKAARLILEGTKKYRKKNRTLPKITDNMFQYTRHFKWQNKWNKVFKRGTYFNMTKWYLNIREKWLKVK